jgi:23S rRNA-/tRNA-specific pseudouridylate synthase
MLHEYPSNFTQMWRSTGQPCSPRRCRFVAARSGSGNSPTTIGTSSRCPLDNRFTTTLQPPRIGRQPQLRRFAFTTFTKLPLPAVLFASNHLLAVYKPPGWHSIPHSHHSRDSDSDDENQDPNEVIDTSKCLMTHLQRCKLGGGSQQTYLKPLHRLDQPCSGVMLWGKTTKAASRLQRLFLPLQSNHSPVYDHSLPSSSPPLLTHSKDGPNKHNHGMLKTYYVVVESPPSNTSTNESHEAAQQWTTVEGYLVRHRRRRHSNSSRQSDHGSVVSKGWSVTVLPMTRSVEERHNALLGLRHCQLAYRTVQRVARLPPPSATGILPIATNTTLLQVHTKHGARHVIRALLSQVARMPVVGDVRYGARTALPDQSVALHAYRLQWPLSKDTMETEGGRNTATVPGPGHVEAPIPDTWYSWFGWSQDDIVAWERSHTHA